MKLYGIKLYPTLAIHFSVEVLKETPKRFYIEAASNTYNLDFVSKLDDGTPFFGARDTFLGLTLEQAKDRAVATTAAAAAVASKMVRQIEAKRRALEVLCVCGADFCAQCKEK